MDELQPFDDVGYNISKTATGGCGAFGDNSPSAKITEKIALCIIEDLKDINNRVKDIAKKYGASSAIVSCIYNKKTWKHLTKDIEFPVRSRSCIQKDNSISKEDVKTIITYLLDGKSNKEISDIMNIHPNKISQIRHHESFNYYTDGIEFPIVDGRKIHPELCAHAKLTEHDVKEIYDLFDAGKEKYEIAQMFDISEISVGEILIGKTWKNLFKKYNRKKGYFNARPFKEKPFKRKGICVKCVTTGIIYNSISSAAKDTGCGERQIKMMCDGIKVKTRNGYTFEYYVEEKIKVLE